ncbi:MAG TPA: DUF2255 family protein [Balneolaceae bacterium]|nr:DUF2255 family protein [Balneolaceae bacterium]
MSTWNKEDLRNIIEEDDLHIAPFRADGETYGTPTWIWCVSVGGDLYVRAYNGQNSRWYQSAMQQKAGRIHAAGKKWEVSFEPVEGDEINDKIDDAYREKYDGSQYLSPMISERTRSATVRVNPRDNQ